MLRIFGAPKIPMEFFRASQHLQSSWDFKSHLNKASTDFAVDGNPAQESTALLC